MVELSDLLKLKLKELSDNFPNKIDQIKGNGILNGIIFKSYPTQVANLLSKLPSDFIKDKSFFLKKITATAVSSELYKKYNILTAINDSSFSNHLCVSPSLIIKKKEVDYFFDSLSKILNENLNLKSIEIILNFIKSKL